MDTSILDIHKVPFSRDGIAHYYWPVCPAEVHQLFSQLLELIVAYIREAETLNLFGVDAAKIVYRYFIGQVIALYEAHLLLARSDKDGVQWLHTQTHPWITMIREKQSPEVSAIIRRLQCAPARPSRLRQPLRLARDLWVARKENMIRRSWRACRYDQDIVSLSLNPLAVQHVKAISERVYYQRDEFWFRKPEPGLIASAQSYAEIIAGFLACVKRVLDQMPEQLMQYLNDWLALAMPLLQAYLDQLEQRELPQCVWANTASHLWGRILARQVRKRGGRVVRFSHGSGGGYFKSPHAQGIHDYEDCDLYVTRSQRQADARRHAFSQRWVVQKQCPEIKVSPVIAKLQRSVAAINRKPRTKKIMYVASIYRNGHFCPGAVLMSNHTLLDWEVRLMSQLKTWGHEVVFKPHPTESICLAPPKSIESILGISRTDQLFENVYQEVDLIILDDPSTSLFVTLLTSTTPFVYLDFNTADFSKEALNLLKKRCCIVQGKFDSENRAKIDWNELHAAIQSAPQYCNNREFFDFYF